MDATDKKNLAENLRRLCAHYPSLADVCRRMGINRPQFNRYLVGKTAPSPHSLKRICDFFGVEESEITLPPSRFAADILARPLARSPITPPQAMMEQIFSRFPDSQSKLERYCGYYFSYVCSPANPKMVSRAISVFYQDESFTYEKYIERLKNHETKRRDAVTFSKFYSVLLHSEDRIYIHSFSPVSHDSLPLTVLYPSHRSQVDILNGICLSVSGGPGRQAFAARTVYEYLGKDINKKEMLGLCGLYSEDSDKLDPAILSRVRNAFEPWENALCAVAY